MKGSIKMRKGKKPKTMTQKNQETGCRTDVLVNNVAGLLPPGGESYLLPPEIMFRSPGDREQFEDPDVVLTEVQEARDKIWARITPTDKLLLPCDFGRISLCVVAGDIDPYYAEPGIADTSRFRDSMAGRLEACRSGPGITLNLFARKSCGHWADVLLVMLAHAMADAIVGSQRRAAALYGRHP
jgi:hypothetical protein